LKKYLLTVILLLLLPILAACNGGAEINSPATQAQNSLAYIIDEQPPETYPERTIEELGAVIVAAGNFWEDFWGLSGIFSWEHFDDTPWEYWIEQPNHPRSLGFERVKPTFAFNDLADVTSYLLQFYTDVWVNREFFGERTAIGDGDIFFGEPWGFAEYDGNLYVHTARIGTLRPNWETATHVLISQDGNIAVVETMVVAYDHRGSGEEMPVSSFRFVFYNGRIENGIGQW